MELPHSAQSTIPHYRFAAQYLKKMATGFWLGQGQLQSYLNFLLCEIDPLFSQKRLAAEVVRVISETDETTTLLLRPSARWKHFRAGQFIAVELEIEGIRYRRNYSLSCSQKHFKKTGLISITAKQVAGGKVSDYINHSLNAADIIHISQAMGHFTWEKPAEGSAGTLFVAGGSGITPIKSMIDQLVHEKSENLAFPAKEPITLIHYAKSANDIIFKNHFEKLAKDYENFTYACHLSDREGVIDLEQLARDCPELKKRKWYLCGPEGFMDAVLNIAKSIQVGKDQICTESFGGGRTFDSSTELGSPGKITFRDVNKQVQSDGQQSLLELAEQAGLKPKYGCRNGICHECKCQRPPGRLFNRMTGELVPDDQHTIQSCITVPAGDLTLNQW